MKPQRKPDAISLDFDEADMTEVYLDPVDGDDDGEFVCTGIDDCSSPMGHEFLEINGVVRCRRCMKLVA